MSKKKHDSEVEKASAEFEKARYELEKLSEKLQSEGLSLEERIAIRTEMALAESRVRVASHNLNQAIGQHAAEEVAEAGA